MNPVFHYRQNTIDRPQRSSRGVIDHTTPGVYIYKPFSPLSFERVPGLVPQSRSICNLVKKRKTMGVKTEPDPSRKKLDIEDLHCYAKVDEIFKDIYMVNSEKMTNTTVYEPIYRA